MKDENTKYCCWGADLFHSESGKSDEDGFAPVKNKTSRNFVKNSTRALLTSTLDTPKIRAHLTPPRGKIRMALTPESELIIKPIHL